LKKNNATLPITSYCFQTECNKINTTAVISNQIRYCWKRIWSVFLRNSAPNDWYWFQSAGHLPIIPTYMHTYVAYTRS